MRSLPRGHGRDPVREIRARILADQAVGVGVGYGGQGPDQIDVVHAGSPFTTGASAVLKLPVYDTQCGAKAFRATPALRAEIGRAHV